MVASAGVVIDRLARPVLVAFLAGAVLAADAGAESLRVRWLGVAGFSIRSGDAVLLHDPYLSRPGLLEVLFTRYEPDPAVLEPLLGAGSPAPELAQARWILIGHSHFDHLGDAAWLAGRSGAELAGSETSLHLARAYGLEESRARRVEPGDAFRAGPFAIQVVESRHARVLLGRVPLEGTLGETPEGPVHAFSFPLGDARGYLVEASGLRLFLLSSAAVHEPALNALAGEPPVDLLLAPTRGRDADYARRLVDALRPRRIVLHHFDDFFRGLDDPEAGAATEPEDLAAFADELRAAATERGLETEIAVLELFEALVLPAPEAQ